MALRTEFTDLLAIEHPIASAPMGGSAGGELAAAVSNAGGLGLLGAGRYDLDWIERELAILVEHTDKPWGIGFQSWATEPAKLERALGFRPHAVMLAFGDPTPLIAPVRAAGALLLMQVTDMAEAEQAVAAGADVIIAQGTESGGHGARRGRSTLTFVPVVADLAAPTPVLAAGGIADGRGLAAALTLGAAGALVGTRFQAATEALVAMETSTAIIKGRGQDTERSAVLDIVREVPWPAEYTARTLAHPFLEQWRDREAELAQDADARRGYRAAVARGDLPPSPVWASEAIDLIDDVRPAAELVGALVAAAEAALGRAWGVSGRG
ncbi:NAD(P)H-dependent flavin oxidoreductase [Nocardia huaxiensis]|uniref:NAD(P)H-dependent flavin oxidoreductase n=1 Tax=Nocardia huaxiensis TaxID=2755382 RepID=UPI001E288867|nr:nitronate monooxygenase [Nocardia huaxiensis]UFS99086.1 nitronate monooxygenase [Nocardia huaxiensis]